MTRPADADAFLAAAGWGRASRRPLAGDASARRYERLTREARDGARTGAQGGAQEGAPTAILMDAPPGRAGPVAGFARIAAHLASLGLSAPRILAMDEARGFMLLEDLGDDLFARLLARDPSGERELYLAAADALLVLQSAPPPAGLDDPDAAGWAQTTGLAAEWYARAITGTAPDAGRLCTPVTAALEALADGPRVPALRDYHAENLLWLPGRGGVARVGLLDFQDAMMGQPEYDLVSLVQDARRDVTPATAAAVTARFAAASGRSAGTVAGACAALGAMRALRILGVFARLCLRDGKPRYLALVPRVWGHLQQNLAHPALRDLARECERMLPPPTPENLRRIGERCGPRVSR